MENNNPTKPKRIKHCYLRKEIYHRFIHSDEYAYTSDNNQVSCKGNYLVVGEIGKLTTIEDIEEMWYYNSNRMIAIIDRKLKRILINETYSFHTWDLKNAVPDDYTIYLTKETIPDKDILLNTKQCLKIYSKYLIKQYVENYLTQYYSILYANKKTIHNNIKDEFKAEGSCLHRTIYNFVKDNDIKKYDFYKECFDSKYKLRIYTTGWSSITKEIKLPTLKQIITGKVFTPKEQLLLEQHWFWTKYCYGNGISFETVKNCWNKEPVKDSVNFNKYNIYFNPEWVTTQKTWQEFVILAVEAERKRYNNQIKNYIAKSDDNYKKAKEELDKFNVEFNLDNWREHKITNIKRISYRKYIPPRRKNTYGKWIDAEVSNSYCGRKSTFANVQLRLSIDKSKVETNKGAVVPLTDAITCFKLFTLFKNKYEKKLNHIFDNTKCGIYNLRFIKYKEKVDDYGGKMGYNDWLIQIGCHSIWLTEIKDFIKYYNLEEQFGITKENNSNVKLKLKVK